MNFIVKNDEHKPYLISVDDEIAFVHKMKLQNNRPIPTETSLLQK